MRYVVLTSSCPRYCAISSIGTPSTAIHTEAVRRKTCGEHFTPARFAEAPAPFFFHRQHLHPAPLDNVGRYGCLLRFQEGRVKPLVDAPQHGPCASLTYWDRAD